MHGYRTSVNFANRYCFRYSMPFFVYLFVYLLSVFAESCHGTDTTDTPIRNVFNYTTQKGEKAPHNKFIEIPVETSHVQRKTISNSRTDASMKGGRVPTSITRTLLLYHQDGHWLASLQLCNFLTEQRVRLCPEHLFIAADTVETHRPDLSFDFLKTFCTGEQQPSLVGLLSGPSAGSWRKGRANVQDVRSFDYVCENMAFVGAHGHHIDGIRLVKNCNSHPKLLELLASRISESSPEQATAAGSALSDGVRMLFQTCQKQFVRIAASKDGSGRQSGTDPRTTQEDVVTTAVETYCNVQYFSDALHVSLTGCSDKEEAVLPSRDDSGVGSQIAVLDPALDQIVAAVLVGTSNNITAADPKIQKCLDITRRFCSETNSELAKKRSPGVKALHDRLSRVCGH